jgi:hypothetical protein
MVFNLEDLHLIVDKYVIIPGDLLDERETDKVIQSLPSQPKVSMGSKPPEENIPEGPEPVPAPTIAADPSSEYG